MVMSADGPAGALESGASGIKDEATEVSPSVTHFEAAGLLIALTEVLGDPDVQEALALVDEQAGGIMEGWRPPWLDEGVEDMSFDFEMLSQFSREVVVSWVQGFSMVVGELAAQAEGTGGCVETRIAVVPDAASAWQRKTLETLLSLVQGRVVSSSAWRQEESDVPYATQILQLDSLSGPESDSTRPLRSEGVESEAAEPRVPTGPLTVGPSQVGLLLQYGASARPPLLHQVQMMQLLRGHPPAAPAAAAETDTETSITPATAAAAGPVSDLSSSSGSALKSGFFNPPARPTPAADEVVSENRETRDGELPNTKECESREGENTGDQEQRLEAEAPNPSEPKPLFIEFIQLNELQAAHQRIGEAAGLIMGVMQLLRHNAVKQVWAQLDEQIGGLLGSWEPPWAEDIDGDIDVERLAKFPEGTIYGWAMNLDGFLSFLAKIATAMRATAAAGRRVETEGVTVSEEDDGDANADAVQDEPKASACAFAADVSEGAGSERGETQPDTPPQTCAASVVLVAVLPDRAADWHLEVLGPLVISLGVFMVYESGWQRDFLSAKSVPFSVEVVQQLSTSWPWSSKQPGDQYGLRMKPPSVDVAVSTAASVASASGPASEDVVTAAANDADDAAWGGEGEAQPSKAVAAAPSASGPEDRGDGAARFEGSGWERMALSDDAREHGQWAANEVVEEMKRGKTFADPAAAAPMGGRGGGVPQEPSSSSGSSTQKPVDAERLPTVPEMEPSICSEAPLDLETVGTPAGTPASEAMGENDASITQNSAGSPYGVESVHALVEVLPPPPSQGTRAAPTAAAATSTNADAVLVVADEDDEWG